MLKEVEFSVFCSLERNFSSEFDANFASLGILEILLAVLETEVRSRVLRIKV